MPEFLTDWPPWSFVVGMLPGAFLGLVFLAWDIHRKAIKAMRVSQKDLWKDHCKLKARTLALEDAWLRTPKPGKPQE